MSLLPLPLEVRAGSRREVEKGDAARSSVRAGFKQVMDLIETEVAGAKDTGPSVLLVDSLAGDEACRLLGLRAVPRRGPL